MNTSTAPNKKERIDIGIAMIVVLLFASFILYQGLSDATASTSIISQLSSDVTAINERTPIVVAATTYTPITLAAGERTIVEPERIGAIAPVVTSYQQAQRHRSTTEATITTDSTTSSIEVVEDHAVNSDSSDSTAAIVSPTIDSSVVSEGNIVETNTTTSMPALDKGCMIVIGAFSRATNVEKLIQNLKADGHNPFTTPYKGMTRVGVYSSCDNTILYTKLRTISKKYAADAFALKGNN